MKALVGLAMLGGALWALLDDKPKRVPALQRQFDEFHDAIKLDEDDERRKLREKREVLLKSLAANLPSDAPKFESFVQGSYAMRTGVVPKDGNYDIDVGIIFDCPLDRYPDPVQLKRLVRDALDSNGRTVSIRRACVTVTYMRKGAPDYHVDLAIYVRRLDGKLLLAKGREFSTPKQRKWEASSPTALTDYLCKRFSGDNQAQFRRCVRYLKRWRDENFDSGAPLSIALTLAAAAWFVPKHDSDGRPQDVEALSALVGAMIGKFDAFVSFAQGRMVVRLPFPSGADLMKGMSDIQMAVFKERLQSLKNALKGCYGDVTDDDACILLRSQLGPDFPLPAQSA